ncbi:MAG: DUF6766 family protein [Microbacteriaceae bacterium]
MVRWLREHGLVLINSALFVFFLIGMTLNGWLVANVEAVSHGGAADSLGGYLLSGNFWEALAENWESEFLQMASYVAFTIFLFQRGSSESKPIGTAAPQDADPRQHRKDPHAPWPVRRGGWVLVLYENSMLLLFLVLFIAAFVTHAIGGAAALSEDQQLHGQPAVGVWDYLATPQFWFESFQNWQSEFMVVALLAGAAVYLRQRGSPESKPVHAPHNETG